MTPEYVIKSVEISEEGRLLGIVFESGLRLSAEALAQFINEYNNALNKPSDKEPRDEDSDFPQRSDSLENRWFHTFSPDGKIERQGQVLAISGVNDYLVQWFSWIDGRANGESIVSYEEMEDWTFYQAREEMDAAYPALVEKLKRKGSGKPTDGFPYIRDNTLTE